MGIEPFAFVNMPESLWEWGVWILVGGIAGALADQLVQGNKLGILGNIVVGILGGILGGLVLQRFGLGAEGIVASFLTAFAGAVVLLLIVRILTGGRGVGKRAN
ncbi:MAG TPA: GlsB/YeaQ/YmgE family stress response membrane protein [Ktedonobacterales bacterium]